MFLAAALFLPLVLLALPLAMERIERPLRAAPAIESLAHMLPDASAEELERAAAAGYAPAVERFWQLRRLGSRRAPRGSSRR